MGKTVNLCILLVSSLVLGFQSELRAGFKVEWRVEEGAVLPQVWHLFLHPWAQIPSIKASGINAQNIWLKNVILSEA